MPDEPRFSVDTLLDLPRLSGLALSPDGEHLVVAIARRAADGKKFVSALWALDPDGRQPPRRLTRSEPGESAPAFLPDGGLLFTSTRPDAAAGEDGPRKDAAGLWLLPAGGGEASLLAGPPGGVDGVAVARNSGDVVFAAFSHPASDGWDADAEKEKARADAGVAAQLFTDWPIRYWDHYLGPRERHLHTAASPAADTELDHRDLAPQPGRRLDRAEFDVTPDGATVVTTRTSSAEDLRERRHELIAIDASSGEERVLASDDAWYWTPACSPDGRQVVCVREEDTRPENLTVWLVDLGSGEGRDLTPDLDLWPTSPVWAADGSAVFFTADQDGHTPVFRLDLGDGRVTRLAHEGAFSDLCPSPDGTTLFALRSLVTAPPQPVVLDAAAEDQQPRVLQGPWTVDVPGALERVSVEAADGTQIRSWLLLPEDASAQAPAPLTVFIHGGPLNSWTGWHWRWSPHVFSSRGWAVLLPDPALSTGYGQANIERGWGEWGTVVYDDLMRAVDGVVKRPDIDETRTAAMGGSFGGYMANWIAGHSDRFDAIVTHASLWALEQFHGTTDHGVLWEREFGDPYTDPSRYIAHSPNRFVGNITTPMLVVHGEKDFRVPVGEGLRLWTDLRRHGVEARFLYFPDENHWVLKPNNSRVWYATVCAFLDHHVLGREWTQPELL